MNLLEKVTFSIFWYSDCRKFC